MYRFDADEEAELHSLADSLSFWRTILNVGIMLMVLTATSTMTLVAIQQMALQNIDARVRQNTIHLHEIIRALGGIAEEHREAVRLLKELAFNRTTVADLDAARSRTETQSAYHVDIAE